MSPFYLPAKSAGAGAPQVEDGLAILRFDDLTKISHPDWAGTDTFGHADDGERYHFQFTLLDEAHAVQYTDGDPIELEAMTRTSTGEKSNFFAYLSAMLTPAELAQYNEATADNPFDGSMLQGRVLNAKIVHNKKGWPQIDAIIGIAKPKGK